MWAFDVNWTPVENHDWQCQKHRKNGSRCKGETPDKFTPVCRAHLTPEIEDAVRLIESAYVSGLRSGQDRTRSMYTLQKQWENSISDSSLDSTNSKCLI